MSKETKKWWDATSQYYQEDSKIPVDIHYGPGAPHEKVMKLLGNLKGKKVLEIGCGGAQCGIAMAKKGAIVSGIDISNKQLNFAKNLAEKNKVKVKFYQGDIKKLTPIKSNSQDLVFTAWALMYVDDLKSCFKEVYRVLKKGGFFIAAMPHPFYFIFDHKKMKLNKSYFDVGKQVDEQIWGDGSKHNFVIYNNTVGGIFNKLTEAGLKVEKIIEPDSRKKHAGDPWYGMWEFNSKMMKYVPPTIIFKRVKK